MNNDDNIPTGEKVNELLNDAHFIERRIIDLKSDLRYVLVLLEAFESEVQRDLRATLRGVQCQR